MAREQLATRPQQLDARAELFVERRRAQALAHPGPERAEAGMTPYGAIPASD